MDIKSYVEFELKSTYEKLSELFDIPLEKVMEWVENPGDLSAKYWNKILEKSYHTIDFMEAYEKPNSSALNFNYSYLNKNEKNQITEIFDEFDVTYVDNRITKYKNLVSIMQFKMIELIKKPKVAFLGRSDAGKSSIINSLLGVDKMPVSWTPVTSIVVYIKHIEDRPAYMENSTYIFKL
jgi:ribosome biogenesis GTPase A